LEGTTRFPTRLRTSSVHSGGSRQRFHSPRPSVEPSHQFAPERPRIVAPTPRRHLLETSESQHWLRTPPLSPSSSRAVSPILNPTATVLPRRRDIGNRHLSFSSLAEGGLSNSALTAHHVKSEGTVEEEAGMGKRWIRWMHRQGMKGWVVPCAIVASTWIKWCIGLGSYSGEFQYTDSIEQYVSQKHVQGTVHRLCLVTTRRNVIGWS
jgi:alpha-1,3-glucosyltransferase